MKELLKKLEILTLDLNERDESLRLSEEKFRKFFEESKLPMAFFNVKEEKFSRVNKTMCDALGYSEDELLSYHVIHFLFDKESQQNALERIEYRKKHPEDDIPPAEVRYKRKNGDEIWLRWHSFKSSIENIYHSIAVDVTNEIRLRKRVKELEEELSGLKK